MPSFQCRFKILPGTQVKNETLEIYDTRVRLGAV